MGRATDPVGEGVVFSEEPRLGAKRIALAVVMIIFCVFSYSVGWQKGWINGSKEADAQFRELNDALILRTRTPALVHERIDDAGDSA